MCKKMVQNIIIGSGTGIALPKPISKSFHFYNE